MGLVVQVSADDPGDTQIRRRRTPSGPPRIGTDIGRGQQIIPKVARTQGPSPNVYRSLSGDHDLTGWGRRQEFTLTDPLRDAGLVTQVGFQRKPDHNCQAVIQRFLGQRRSGSPLPRGPHPAQGGG